MFSFGMLVNWSHARTSLAVFGVLREKTRCRICRSKKAGEACFSLFLAPGLLNVSIARSTYVLIFVQGLRMEVI